MGHFLVKKSTFLSCFWQDWYGILEQIYMKYGWGAIKLNQNGLSFEQKMMIFCCKMTSGGHFEMSFLTFWWHESITFIEHVIFQNRIWWFANRKMSFFRKMAHFSEKWSSFCCKNWQLYQASDKLWKNSVFYKLGLWSNLYKSWM